ncbi:DUF4309 domain-containing protein [Halalkalibacterium halodurans]|uniref:BH2091 protein n=2 Tax=Halalkalibacterium halodurans TaxID=86665 RepID=Q9KB43_HALH5|nr:DUF4309 domain-containing protein [Halalkalibacterium halodurans]MED4123504.1 DUF4309 domain-containing protein [Halalkalibacterium halodurans]MED4174864.1 DUF4309 domain-containing protein [Halalkalibacterium halodurans]TPE67951.1 DUF4309 domain-containing protein [Halalkalibacterium halodurans]BAB05810.1 BH2091 [Halalkalibacterium halodurans C-125]
MKLKQASRVIKSFVIFTFALLMASGSAFASDASKSEEANVDQLIQQIMGLASESQQTISSVPFAVGDSLKKVEKSWGPADDLSTVAANYWSRHIRFLYDGSMGRKPITAIDDFDPKLQTIHLSDVKRLVGEPVSEVEQEGMYYVTYTDYENYKIVFNFESAWMNPDPILHMYTVEKINTKGKRK